MKKQHRTKGDENKVGEL